MRPLKERRQSSWCGNSITPSGSHHGGRAVAVAVGFRSSRASPTSRRRQHHSTGQSRSGHDRRPATRLAPPSPGSSLGRSEVQAESLPRAPSRTVARSQAAIAHPPERSRAEVEVRPLTTRCGGSRALLPRFQGCSRGLGRRCLASVQGASLRSSGPAYQRRRRCWTRRLCGSNRVLPRQHTTASAGAS